MMSFLRSLNFLNFTTWTSLVSLLLLALRHPRSKRFPLNRFQKLKRCMKQNTCWILKTVLLQPPFLIQIFYIITWGKFCFKILVDLVNFSPMLSFSMFIEFWFIPISVSAGTAPEANLCINIHFMFLVHVEGFGLLICKNCLAKATFVNWFWMISKQVFFDSHGGCKFKLANVTQVRISLDIIRAVSRNVIS